MRIEKSDFSKVILLNLIIIFFTLILYLWSQNLFDNIKISIDLLNIDIKILQDELSEVVEINEEFKEIAYDLGEMTKLNVLPRYDKDVIATAYCPCEKCCGKYSDGYTSTGTKATQGRTIAVDPKIIPYGTKIYIPYFKKVFISEDSGSAIKQNKIDVYYNTHGDALEFGKKEFRIYIVK